ncbi:hypothetical protein EDB80DRAFT_866449 [Ilyonectria destructans]|nr:hypothetical protein EDB80DRAFT_866449 [Ilyonectria destructans]
MVCSFCRCQILESGETWGYHHHKLPQFKQSLQEECSLCARLSDDLRERFDPEHKLKFAAGQSSWLDDWLSDGSPQDAVYTWTLRKAATVTRESQEMVVLRYRPNLGTNVEQKKQDKRQQLSDRAFYFLLQDVNSRAENPQDKERGVENEEGTDSG